MTLITVNTPDPAGYAAWARSNAEDISKANGAVAMGLCSPTTGAEQMGDHYLWSFFPSQQAVWSSDPMNPTVQKAVASMNVERTAELGIIGGLFGRLKHPKKVTTIIST